MSSLDTRCAYTHCSTVGVRLIVRCGIGRLSLRTCWYTSSVYLSKSYAKGIINDSRFGTSHGVENCYSVGLQMPLFSTRTRFKEQHLSEYLASSRCGADLLFPAVLIKLAVQRLPVDAQDLGNLFFVPATAFHG